jgi:hypothetical protein
MIEKFDIYDAVTSLLQGTIFFSACLVLFPQTMKIVGPLGDSEIVLTLMSVSIAYFIGQVVVSISSMIQPFLFWSWGGKPSKLAFEGKLPEKYISVDMVELARTALKKSSSLELSDAALFNKAMSIARKADGSLSERHNQMYAYNRASFCNLLLILGLFAMSCNYGLCKNLSIIHIFGIVIGFLLLLLLHWYRTKQRAFYYVREVLIVAERELSRGA